MTPTQTADDEQDDEYDELWNSWPTVSPTPIETLGPIESSSIPGMLSNKDIYLIVGLVLLFIGICIGYVCYRDPVRRRSFSRRLSNSIPTAEDMLTISHRISVMATGPMRRRSFSGRQTSSNVEYQDGEVIAHYEVNPVLGTHMYTSPLGMEQEMHRTTDYNYSGVQSYPRVPNSILQPPSVIPIEERIKQTNKKVGFVVAHDGNVPESV
jgi:hypothetical protein